MRSVMTTALFAVLLMLQTAVSESGIKREKGHDFVPKVHNVIFILDVSDSMTSGYPLSHGRPKYFFAARSMHLFNRVMPPVPHWQYDLNSALITFGDRPVPGLAGVLGPWNRGKYTPLYPHLRRDGGGPKRTAGMQEALQLAGSLLGTACGRTAIVIFSDGGSMDECPQKTATALKRKFGDKVRVYGVYFGNTEGGWRNLYEVCMLTGGYARHREEVRPSEEMQKFAWDILVREIMFPYPQIYFKYKSADLLPSEALKLEGVAGFLHAIPQYHLQIDGHTDFNGRPGENHKLGMERAKNVKKALVSIFHVHPWRIGIRSWGEELPRFDNQNPEVRHRNREANLYLKLPLRNFPYNEKKLHTFGVKAVGDIYNTQERSNDNEWAFPVKPPPGSRRPVGRFR